MRVSCLLVFIVSLAFVAGCQQADGPMPEPSEDVTNRIDDLSQDVLNVAGGNQQAPGEFLDDLMSFGDSGPGTDAVQALGRSVTPALAGKKIGEEGATQVATQLWLVIAGRSLSERQREAVLNNLRDALSNTGLAQGEIESVVAKAGEAQRASTVRPRRWFERF